MQSVFADMNMINSVVQNLISNAVKFTHQGGTVEINAVLDGKYVKVSVKDNGVGISEEDKSKLFKIDPNTNSIILSGSIEEIDPIQKFLQEIDRPKDRQKYYRFDLNYLDIKDVKSVIPGPFKHHEFINVPNTNSFVMLLSPEKKEIFDQYLKMIDTSVEVEYVKLKYIKADYLKEHHPPSITQEDIIETGDPSIIFEKGSSDKLDAFYRELELLDRPVPQIRYVLLVIQYQEGESLKVFPSISIDYSILL